MEKTCSNCYYLNGECPQDGTICGDKGVNHKWKPSDEASRSLLLKEIQQLKEALELCNEQRTWCYSCQCAMGNLVFGVRHTADCEYIRLTK